MATGELEGRIAVVTGGGKGIGAAVAQALAAAGASVVISGRDEKALASVAAQVREMGGRVEILTCDVTRPDDVTRLATETRARLGRAQIVVNNAGVAQSAKFGDTDEALWARHLDVNLTGAYRVTRAFLDDVMAAGARGRIINIASVAAKIGWAYTAAYCASKHGLLGMTRALAVEIAAKGPTVNCVCPGWVDTDMADGAIQNIARMTKRSMTEARADLERMSPQRRLMTAPEIASVVRFLASDGASGVTGQGWNVDGGGVVN